MTSHRPHTLILPVLLMLAGCYAAPPEPVEVDAAANEPAAALEPAPERAEPARTPEPSRRRAELERSASIHAMTEVELDPRGEAALTLDSQGGVRLWPLLDAGPSQGLPYRIPVHDPLWLSLAQAEGGYTLGFIGTNNAGAVYQVELPADGPASIVESFALSPEDPLLELHVLAGGARILALGVDHRVRLYAVDGELLSVIDERGFGPWQLRVTGGQDGTPKLAAMLAQPLRVQPLRLDGDQLEIAGPARAVELDRGPNRNDLALSPDGKTIAALRRPRGKRTQWSVELIDLETDARTLVAGRVDTKVRPRMHFVADDRLLLESGSGRGYMVDLGEALAPAKADDFDPGSKFAKRLAQRLDHEFITLAGSAEPDLWITEGDTGIRMHASVVNNVRASIDRAGWDLVTSALAR